MIEAGSDLSFVPERHTPAPTEAGVRAAAERQRRWLEENRGAIEDANRFLAKHGLWSDGKRLF